MVEVAFYDLRPLSFYLALAIASTKSGLVILYFMHLRHSSPLTWVFVRVGFFWLAMLIVFALGDCWTRDWIDAPQGWM